MNYNRKYPNAKIDEEPEEGIFKGRHNEPCYICGTRTPWIDLSFEIHVCSDECSSQVWAEYVEANKPQWN